MAPVGPRPLLACPLFQDGRHFDGPILKFKSQNLLFLVTGPYISTTQPEFVQIISISGDVT